MIWEFQNQRMRAFGDPQSRGSSADKFMVQKDFRTVGSEVISVTPRPGEICGGAEVFNIYIYINN